MNDAFFHNELLLVNNIFVYLYYIENIIYFSSIAKLALKMAKLERKKQIMLCVNGFSQFPMT